MNSTNLHPDNKQPNLRSALAILSRDPENVAANIQAGVFFSQNRKLEQSLFHLKKALARDRKNPLILEKLADVSIKSGDIAHARKYARKLLDLKKRDPRALHVMARVSEALGDMDKAIYWIDLSLQQDPDNLLILNDKAYFHSYRGEMDESLKIHKKILDLNPLSPGSWWPFAQLQKLDAEATAKSIEKVEKAISASVEPDELRGMHYAAGKLNQDIEAHDIAFGHIEKANLSHGVPICADKIIAANINFRETYSKEFFKARQDTGDQSEAPVFILGQTRSGTTLTESLCASHSNICAGGELINFNEFNSAQELYSIVEKKHRSNIHALDKNQINDMGRDYIAKTRHLRQAGARMSDKLPHNFLNIGLIALLFPNARIIHCRRHPMDNCLSIYSNPMMDYHKEYKSKLGVLGEYYRNYVQIMEFWKKTCPIPIHDVFYEDLVTNTENVARGMIEYLGEEWEEGVMERNGAQNAVKTLSVWQVRQPVFQSSKGKWRNYEKQLQPLRDAMGTCVEDYEKELAQLDNSTNK